MRASFQRSRLDSAQCHRFEGGAWRHPRPCIDVPRAGRQAPARRSTTVGKTELTHTNRSPMNPGHFNLAELATVPLLIIDDLGMRKLPHTAAEDLLELVMRRYERASTLLTSNRPVDDWGKLLRDTAAVTALLDRLRHHAHVLKCGPRSWQTKVQTDLRTDEGTKENSLVSAAGNCRFCPVHKLPVFTCPPRQVRSLAEDGGVPRAPLTARGRGTTSPPPPPCLSCVSVDPSTEHDRFSRVAGTD